MSEQSSIQEYNTVQWNADIKSCELESEIYVTIKLTYIALFVGLTV